MKNFLLTVVALISFGSTAQIIFSEDFNNFGTNFAANGWTLFNQDGLTPAANVAYVTDAWIVREDFIVQGDSCAFSTSWYTPAGTSDDWMATPAINLTSNNVLRWEANAPDAAYPDGYEVRISTTTPTIAGFTANPALFSIAAEASTWTPHSVDLQAAGYSNQTVYLAWRNNSTDQFILMIDSVVVEAVSSPYDGAISLNATEEYTIRPLSQVNAPIGTDGTISAVGSGDITNVTMTVNVYDGTMTNVYNGTSAANPSIAAGNSANFTVPGYLPTAADVYTVELISSIAESDANTANDTLVYTYVVSDSVFARDNGNVTGSLGIGGNTTGELGQNFTVGVSDTITSVSFFLTNANLVMNGRSIFARIYDTDASGTPTTVLTTTETLVIDTTQNNLWTARILGGSYELPVGEYAVIMVELDSNITLGTAPDIFTTGETWVNFPGNPQGGWANNEAYNFNVTYVLRANFGNVPDGCVATTASVSPSICSGDTYTAPSGATFNTTGTFTDVIPNSCGADSVITINLTVNTVNNAVTESGGTLTATASGATYQWIDCDNGNAPVAGETNQTYTPSASGNFAVIITENGCTDTSACTSVTVAPAGLNTIALEGGMDLYPNPSNGTVQLSIDGLKTEMLVVRITGVNGQLVKELTFEHVNGQFSTPLNLTGVENGTYFVNIGANGESITERLVIMNK